MSQDPKHQTQQPSTNLGDDDSDDRDGRKVSQKNSLFNSDRRNSSSRRNKNSSKSCDERDWGDDLCYQDDLCIDSCRRMFSNSHFRTRCENYPLELVYQMQLMLDDFETGLSDNLDTDVLKCMSKIDIQPLLKKVRQFDNRAKKDFLIVIAEEEDIADAVFNADEELNFFDDLAGRDLENLTKDIDGGVNFVTLVVNGNNEEAWHYLEKYLDEYCSSGSNCKKSGGSFSYKFIAYCEMLSKSNKNDVESVIESDLFQDEYDADDLEEFASSCKSYGVNL